MAARLSASCLAFFSASSASEGPQATNKRAALAERIRVVFMVDRGVYGFRVAKKGRKAFHGNNSALSAIANVGSCPLNGTCGPRVPCAAVGVKGDSGPHRIRPAGLP